ncbi:MAG: Uma2 family endonuclease [Betaproteobacteria bacterium]
MGNVTTPETLALRWADVMRDPALTDLPYKIELNAWGKIEMSPANNRHALLQAHIAAEFARQLTTGRPLTECSVLTEIGVRVPDVAWASAEFLDAHGATTPFPRAPEICVEITSPSNTDDEIREKTRAYLAAGSREVWIVSEKGTIEYHDQNGNQPRSAFNVQVALP